MFDNSATVFAANDAVEGGTDLTQTDADLGKYFWDQNLDGEKGVCDDNGVGYECFVDTDYNISQGSQKGLYTQATKSQVIPAARKPVNYAAVSTYADNADFIQRADNTMAAQMRDCAECHVGGGAMESVPVDPTATLDVGVRDLLSANPTAGTINTFNYFIDQYDENANGILGEVIHQDYADTGVLEMDCLMCHMTDYSWEHRKEAIRRGNFDASRVAGANLGTAVNVIAGSSYGAGYGKVVTYNAAMVVNDGSGNATLSAQALNLVEATPPSQNCSNCHFDMHRVDWKKRGTSWDENMAHETDVHASLGCMACHTRDDGIEMDPNNTVSGTGDTIEWTGNGTTGVGKPMLGHDPTKGNAPFSSLWNANDKNVRTCEGCHVAGSQAGGTDASYLGTGGAVDPTNTHANLGLTQLLIQKAGMGAMTGTADGSHIDLMTCEACHTKKMGHGPINTHFPQHNLYEWGTGGALVDSTGADPEGRMTDHENLYVERIMENNLTVGWEKTGAITKLGSRHALLTMFWRDKDDTFGYGNIAGENHVDINADGQDGGMDAVNPTHVALSMAAEGLHVLTEDGVFDDAEINAQKAAMAANLRLFGINYQSKTDAQIAAKLKLSFMGVFFKTNHGTTPANNAWGSGGCTDCHGPDKGFYNGSYDLNPVNLNATWNNAKTDGNGDTVFDNSAVGGGKPKWNHVVPFTKVNKRNYSGRDVTLPICSTYYGPDARPAAPVVGVLGDIGQVCDGPDGIASTGDDGIWTVYALGFIKADYQFTDFHPTIWAKGQKGRSLAIKAVYGATNKIRAMDRSEGLWEAKFVTGGYDGTITGTDGTDYTTRAGWVAYLDGQGNYRPAIHTSHAEQGMACTDCHYDAAGPGNLSRTYAVASDPALMNFQTPAVSGVFTTDVATAEYDDGNGGVIVAPVDPSRVTCSTSCHSAASVLPGNRAMARISSQHSTPSEGSTGQNFTVHLDASHSACYGVNMSSGQVVQGSNVVYAWTVDNTNAAIVNDTCTGNNVADCDVSWDAAATNDVSLTVTCDTPGIGAGTAADGKTIAVTGYDIGAGDNTVAVFTPSYAANVVTIAATTIDSEVATVQVRWGDYTNVLYDIGDFPISHTYYVLGTSDPVPAGTVYAVKLTTTNDGEPNNNQYPYEVTVTTE